MSEENWIVPNIVFKTRVKDEEGKFGWVDVTSMEYFGDKRVILFSLPEHTHQLVQHINYQILRSCTRV